jgi:hypothetical protein
MRVIFTVPLEHRWKCAFPTVHGMQYAFDAQRGTSIAGAGGGSVFVRFDGMHEKQYEAVCADWCMPIEELGVNK